VSESLHNITKIELKVSLSNNNCKKYWTRMGRYKTVEAKII
jgi:hypothetical protein